MKLTDAEKFKIRELQNDSVFMGILDRINRSHNRLTPYKPEKTSGLDQFERFVYSSGQARGVQLVLELIGYRYDRPS